MNPLIHNSGPVALGSIAAAIFRQPAEPVAPTHPFHDRHCLSLVVSHLREIRQARGVSLREVSRRARVAEEVLDLAENGERIPNVRTFKAWCRALHLSWEQVWMDSLDDGRAPSRDSMKSR